ncbi:MAG: 50S ribosomal protein L35 [Christensenellales bacterium]|jgi:large subunit ribosomal protein L35
MPKIKTRKSAAKRFSLTATGRVKRAKAYKNHILNKKTRKTKRNLRHGDLVCAAEEKNVKLLIPYK